MWYSPDALAFIASFVLLAPTESLSASNLHSGVAARAARVAACDAPVLSLPDSIELSPGLQPMVRWSLEHSPTFRQQCRKLAAAPSLHASVRMNFYPTPGSTVRALTTFRQKRSGTVDARIEIRSAPDLTELLAHEFEHVLEQLEGTDLDALSSTNDAKRLSDGAFETRRAIEAGRRVAGEVINNAPDRVRHAGASVWRTLRRAVRRGTAPARERGR
jgi:hypothetical protein